MSAAEKWKWPAAKFAACAPKEYSSTRLIKQIGPCHATLAQWVVATLARTGKMHRLSILQRECIVVIQHNCARRRRIQTRKNEKCRAPCNLSLCFGGRRWQKISFYSFLRLALATIIMQLFIEGKKVAHLEMIRFILRLDIIEKFI